MLGVSTVWPGSQKYKNLSLGLGCHCQPSRIPIGNKISACNPLNNPLTSSIPRIPNPHHATCQLDPRRHGESFQGFKAALPLRAQDDILGGWRGEGGKVEGAANKKMKGIHEDEYGAN